MYCVLCVLYAVFFIIKVEKRKCFNNIMKKRKYTYNTIIFFLFYFNEMSLIFYSF